MHRLAWILIAWLLPLAAAAQDTAAAEQQHHDDEARALFDAGEIAYADGRYDAALTDFIQAHDLSGRPELLYNVALAAERVRHDQQALDAYVAFLAARPTTPNRSAIESRIEILRTAIAEHTTPAPAPETTTTEPGPTPAPAPPPSSGLNVGALTLTIAGGVALIAGLVLIGVSASDASSVMNATYPSTWSSVHGAYNDAQTFSLVGGILTGVGAAAAIAGVIWLALGSGGSSDTQVSFGPGSLSVRGTF